MAGIGFAAFYEGEDFTNELLAESLSARAPSADVATLLRLCARLPHAAKPLTNRRKDKDPFASLMVERSALQKVQDVFTQIDDLTRTTWCSRATASAAASFGHATDS